MITEENKEVFIERYLMGKLSLWELAEVENKIKTDASFAEEVAFERDLLIGIRESRRLELKEKLKTLEAAPRIFRMPILSIDKPKLIRYAIAVCVTIAVMGSLLYPSFSDSMIPNSKRGHYSNASE